MGGWPRPGWGHGGPIHEGVRPAAQVAPTGELPTEVATLLLPGWSNRREWGARGR